MEKTPEKNREAMPTSDQPRAAAASDGSAESTPDDDHGSLTLTDPAQAKDLATLLSRVRTISDSAAVRLQARGTVLAVWVPVMSADSLLDAVPTVLGMRAAHLAEAAHVDATVEAAAVLDRLARIDRTDGRLPVPPVTVRAPWAGMLPPSSGWTPEGRLRAADVEQTAREGMAAVERALPSGPGGAVVNTVRGRIWGETDERGLVRGAYFGATVLGFNESSQGFEIFANAPWHRLSNSYGHILCRAATGASH